MSNRLRGNRRTRQTLADWDEGFAPNLNAISRSNRTRSQLVSVFVAASIPKMVTPGLYYYRPVPADFRGQTSADSGPSAERLARGYKMGGSHIRSSNGSRLSLRNQFWAEAIQG